MAFNDENVLEISKLTKKYNAFSLDEISFSIKKGQIVGFVGINGSGKTTTIKSIAGLVIPDNGEIKFWGEPIGSKNEGKIKNRLGFLLDGDYYYPNITINQMKNITSKAYNNWDEKVFKHLSEKFNLPLNQKISTLSKGMKMKFALALALSHHAEILIMDEPTSGLDPFVRAELINIIKELRNQGVSILFSSHITSDLEKTADDIILIHNGKILFQEKKNLLESNHLVVEGNVNDLSSIDSKMFLKVSKEKNNFEAIYKGSKEMITKNFPNFNVKNANIEDIMLAYIFGGGK